jgi:hypothetical protein
VIARLAIVLAFVLAFDGLAVAQPTPDAPAKTAPAKAKTRPHRRPKQPKQPKTPPTPTPTPTPPPDATPPAPDPTPASPAPAPTPAAPAPDTTSNAPGAEGPPGGSEPPRAPPPPAPKLSMRTKQSAHDGFVSDMDCSACHTAEGWKLASSAGSSGFDHDRTGFPLRGSHVQTQCSGCHTGVKQPPTNCEGCHRDTHQGRMDGECAECHTATAWSDTTTLEQHRRTRMPLTGRHATLDCNACHRRQGERQFSDVPTDCYACHKAKYHDQSVHPNHDGSTGAAAFSRNCALCHRTTSWSPAVTDPTMLPRMAMARTGEHDAFFVLTTGSHRTVECAACHADVRRAKLVRCDGCHQDVALRAQHPTPVARAANACLRCHPRGAAR